MLHELIIDRDLIRKSVDSEEITFGVTGNGNTIANVGGYFIKLPQDHFPDLATSKRIREENPEYLTDMIVQGIRQYSYTEQRTMKSALLGLTTCKATADELITIQDILSMIREELDCLYWDKYQEEIDANDPFGDTGRTMSCSLCTIRAYDHLGTNKLPNFECNGLKVWWLSCFPFGIHAEVDSNGPNTNDFLAETLSLAKLSLLQMLPQIAPR